MHPDTDGGFEMLDSGDISEAVQRRALLEFRAGHDADAIDRMRAAEEDLGIAREAADAAAARATEQQAALESRLAELEASEAQHEQLAAQVAGRVEASLAEAANLATIDSQLASQIEEENRRLAAHVPSAGGGGGRIPISGNLNIVNVRGIQVNADIADELDAMLGAASSAGLSLAGGGYRDPADQVRLREQNCPDPWNSPPSACSPPTARPGPVAARAGTRDRLHVQRRAHQEPQQRVLPMARRPRRVVRVLQPAVRAVALERQRQLGPASQGPADSSYTLCSVASV